MIAEDTFTSTVDGAAGHARQFASEPYDDRPSASDFERAMPAHTCWRNGGVDCRACDFEELRAEAAEDADTGGDYFGVGVGPAT